MMQQQRAPAAAPAAMSSRAAVVLALGLLAVSSSLQRTAAFRLPAAAAPVRAVRSSQQSPLVPPPSARAPPLTTTRLHALLPVGPDEAEAAAAALRQLQLLAMDGVVNGGEEDALESAGNAILAWLANLNYGTVFAASLFPYLAFLRNIWPKDYPIPATMKYGFASLLIFVVSTIIGGIVAKVQYGDVLANIDYLHGTAESLLGVTNIVLAMGAFQALQAAKRDGPREGRRWTD